MIGELILILSLPVDLCHATLLCQMISGFGCHLGLANTTSNCLGFGILTVAVETATAFAQNLKPGLFKYFSLIKLASLQKLTPSCNMSTNHSL